MRRTVIDNLRIVLARARFLKSYVASRLNAKHLDHLPEYVASRLVAAFVDNHPPDIDVRMEILPFWRPFHGIRFDAPVIVVVTLNAAPAFGMALDIKGRNIRIIELHGVKGFCTRGRYHVLRLWPVLLVQACQHLAVESGYRHVLMVRPHRYPSWHKRRTSPTPQHTTRRHGSSHRLCHRREVVVMGDQKTSALCNALSRACVWRVTIQ